MKTTNFINDLEKLLDMKEMTKEDFLASYSYLTEEEYDNTLLRVKDRFDGFKSYKFAALCFSLMDQFIFRLAVSELLAKGYDFFEKLTYDDIIEHTNGNSFRTKNYAITLETVAKHISRLDHIYLLVYISRNVVYAVDDNQLSYEEYKRIAEEACDVATRDAFENEGTEAGLDILRDEIRLNDDQIDTLGFGWALQQID